MKLTPLLAQFLYQNNLLSLPGFGTFTLNPSSNVEADTKKTDQSYPKDIRFTNNPSVKVDDNLIEFIAKQAGKMKILAQSDLSSYLEQMQEFLNIGKPFLIEGIGTLVKTKEGLYDFTPGILSNEKIIDPNVKELANTSSSEESFTGYKEMLGKYDRPGFTFKKIIVALLLFGSIGLAVWGGYAIYKKNKEKKATREEETVAVPVQESKIVTDTSLLQKKQEQEPAITSKPVDKNPGSYNFIFETTQNKSRALKRFYFLKDINPRIQLQTADSALFKIMIRLSVPATDTLRVKDSLNGWYYGKDKTKWRVKIE